MVSQSAGQLELVYFICNHDDDFYIEKESKPSQAKIEQLATLKINCNLIWNKRWFAKLKFATQFTFG